MISNEILGSKLLVSILSASQGITSCSCLMFVRLDDYTPGSGVNLI